ncbi:MAG: DUF1490 domain-containing protein [Clostridiales Family XIII bacterium]|jgi:hypothetical protein|nr:DUF1490 domain-containing protein [Clostridiales Family XIII bacterium]
MSEVKKLLESGSLLAFVGGAAAALIAPRLLKSARVRRAAVCAVAKGMQLQNDALCAFEEIREDAQDIYCEAKERAKSKAQGEKAEENEV